MQKKGWGSDSSGRVPVALSSHASTIKKKKKGRKERKKERKFVYLGGGAVETEI
jgi:hypothetical protein